MNTINHSDIGLIGTNLATLGASHCMVCVMFGDHDVYINKSGTDTKGSQYVYQLMAS